MNEEDYKKELNNLVLRTYKYKVPGVCWGQIKNYHNKLNMSYEGMYKTFLYVLEVKGKTFERNYGLGWVKIFYQEGHNYHRKQVNNKPNTKVTRREIKIKKKAHRPIVEEIDLKEID